MQSWREKNQFPFALGAIDCTHIGIRKPSQFGDEYVNRKGFTSFNVQAICDADAVFLAVDCTWPGSVHDARVWSNSSIRTILESNDCGALIIGDEGYGISPWLMTPYKRPNGPHETNYNRIHTKERVVIERAFGQIKRKFPILSGRIRIKTERIPTVVIACFVLYNVSKYLSDGCPDRMEENVDTVDVDITQFGQGNPKQQGRNRRNHIANSL